MLWRPFFANQLSSLVREAITFSDDETSPKEFFQELRFISSSRQNFWQMEPNLTTNKLNKSNIWRWRDLEITWNSVGSSQDSDTAVVLIHGFGACKEHWRHNQPILGKATICYAIDLIGFGSSSQPQARLQGNQPRIGDFNYKFDF